MNDVRISVSLVTCCLQKCMLIFIIRGNSITIAGRISVRFHATRRCQLVVSLAFSYKKGSFRISTAPKRLENVCASRSDRISFRFNEREGLGEARAKPLRDPFVGILITPLRPSPLPRGEKDEPPFWPRRKATPISLSICSISHTSAIRYGPFLVESFSDNRVIARLSIAIKTNTITLDSRARAKHLEIAMYRKKTKRTNRTEKTCRLAILF